MLLTPNAEVELCGHAALASAHILWERERWFMDSIGFPCEYPSELIEAFNIDPIYVGRNRFDYFIEVESEEVIKNLNPNFSMLRTIKTRGINVTSKSNNFDFISRCFFPAVGVNEDPVTGSLWPCALLEQEIKQN